MKPCWFHFLGILSALMRWNLGEQLFWSPGWHHISCCHPLPTERSLGCLQAKAQPRRAWGMVCPKRLSPPASKRTGTWARHIRKRPPRASASA
jgi:hypothetical protein